MHGFDADWADAALAFGGVARIDHGTGRADIQVLNFHPRVAVARHDAVRAEINRMDLDDVQSSHAHLIALFRKVANKTVVLG